MPEPSGPGAGQFLPTKGEAGTRGVRGPADRQGAVHLADRGRHALTVLSNGDTHINDPSVISGEGEGLVKQLENNVKALRVLKKIRAEERTTATPEEREALIKFVGWGGLRETAFRGDMSQDFFWKLEQCEGGRLLIHVRRTDWHSCEFRL